MKVTKQEFSRLCDNLTQETLDELTACPVAGLGVFLIELKANRGFKATRMYFSNKAIQEILHLNTEDRNVFERWINSFFRK